MTESSQEFAAIAPNSDISEVNKEKEGDPATYHRIVSKLRESKIPFRHLVHEPTPTSNDSLAVRKRMGWADCTLASGAKAMLIVNSKDKQLPYRLAVMSAEKKLNWKLLKKQWGNGVSGRSARMATEDEVKEVTGCVPGGVPPFGSLFPSKTKIPTILDPSLKEQGSRINFNCGLRTRSVSISFEDYVKIENPEMKQFCD